MIAEKCFNQEWISAKAEELRYPDKNVIERVVRAFSLLDMFACVKHYEIFHSVFNTSRKTC